MLTIDQENSLLKAYLERNDPALHKRIVEAYFPLALQAAEAFARRGVAPLDDLVAEAVHAVSQAVDDHASGSSRCLRDTVRFQIKSVLMKRAMAEQGIKAPGSQRGCSAPLAHDLGHVALSDTPTDDALLRARTIATSVRQEISLSRDDTRRSAVSRPI